MEEIIIKYCPACKKDKPIDEFYKRKRNKNGYADYCKLCEHDYKKNRYATNSKYRFKIINNGLKCNHNITPEEYILIYNAQEGKCAICGKSQSILKSALCIDHDHITGKFRGLLCTKCNIAVGNFDDSIINLKSAISYIEKYC